eukprot:gene18372-20222_t
MALSWNFFATSHGKGPVDDIGGCLKRIATDKVKTRQSAINNSADFYEAVKGSSVSTTLITSEEVQQNEMLLGLPELFANAASIKGILDFHWIELTDGDISTRKYSSGRESVNGHDDCNAVTASLDSVQNGIAETAPDVNTSKSTTDVDSVPFSDVFLHIDPPMPVSSSRCSFYRHQDDNFQCVKDFFKDFCGL